MKARRIVGELLLFLVIGSTIWVAADATGLGARRGVRPGKSCDQGPVAWFFACALLWIVFFPMYLAARPQYVDAKRRRTQLALTPPAPTAVAPAPTGRGSALSTAEELERLAGLRDSGNLTAAEFATLKGRLLAQGG